MWNGMKNSDDFPLWFLFEEPPPVQVQVQVQVHVKDKRKNAGPRQYNGLGIIWKGQL